MFIINISNLIPFVIPLSVSKPYLHSFHQLFTFCKKFFHENLNVSTVCILCQSGILPYIYSLLFQWSVFECRKFQRIGSIIELLSSGEGGELNIFSIVYITNFYEEHFFNQGINLIAVYGFPPIFSITKIPHYCGTS